jgi:hypothetical protein
MDGLFTHLRETAELTANMINSAGSGRGSTSTAGYEDNGDIADIIPIERVKVGG